ncbi:MAG: hypothetical protein MJZ37_00145 [Bacilli bacterium]|nr:hypothetical protein [Bacilli bacterium]
MKVHRIVIKKGNLKREIYKKAAWHEEHELLTCTLIAVIFWAVALTAFCI